MSAAVLREAAQTIRFRVESITAGPWESTDNCGPVVAAAYGSPDDGDVVAGTNDMAHSDYLASWHPLVALAVADWLEQVAVSWHLYEGHAIRNTALVVARTYLGGVS